mgnify:CR=1 FL=1
MLPCLGSTGKKAISILEGKGGGSAFSSQGWGKNSERLDEALDTAINEIKNKIK